MKTRLVLALFVMTALFVGALWMNRRFTHSAPVINHSTTISATPPPVVEPAVGVEPAVPGGSADTAPAAAGTAATPPEVQAQMETVKFFLRDFRAALGGNPVGNNAEITKALMGANSRQTKFIAPGDSAVNGAGELVDAWGTPYFFHALSAREMEIHSAGPDKRLWTSDDIVLR